ncbi:cyclic nucleotide-binding domain-containing protein [Nocardioides panaciterrulae]|uniref:CRP-like cAMP-binding protein n=1 Tax=Nocardioides panaciterrulae TaxID=661492 RepID=A0A7Y9J9K0_9ACTN|nr:cyclic nucleotide-binding domain-containing protein [Nocardioides panaciterrulae]NYD40690.1 CRP-like cAMP-binding protein [Nocardioides panaciterrulae]
MSEKSELENRLAALPIFAGLSRRQLGKLVDQSKRVPHPAGREVATEGEGALALHLILSGKAEVTRHGKAVRTLGEGDYFGEISMIDGRRRSATVTASTELTTLAVPHAVFERLLRDDAGFALELLKVLCGRLRESEPA